MQISFYGATGAVTGSKYLFNDGAAATLVDCGNQRDTYRPRSFGRPDGNLPASPGCLNDANRRHCHMRQSLHDTHAASATRKVLAPRQT